MQIEIKMPLQRQIHIEMQNTNTDENGNVITNTNPSSSGNIVSPWRPHNSAGIASRNSRPADELIRRATQPRARSDLTERAPWTQSTLIRWAWLEEEAPGKAANTLEISIATDCAGTRQSPNKGAKSKATKQTKALSYLAQYSKGKRTKVWHSFTISIQ